MALYASFATWVQGKYPEKFPKLLLLNLDTKFIQEDSD